MCFDAYFIDNKDVRHHPLVQHSSAETSRISIMKDFCSKTLNTYINEPMIFDMNAKKFHYAETEDISLFQKKIKTCYENDYIYHVDGLIFTPKEIAVGSVYKNIVPDYTQRDFGGTWNRVFKWKPANENSIDMLVSIQQKNVFVNNVGSCHLCNLIVAGSENDLLHVNPIDIVSNKNKIVKSNGQNTFEKVFDTVYLPITDTNKFPKTKEHENIYDKSIVEFIYDDAEPQSMKWKPYRIRYDKTELYKSKSKNKITGAANHISTAQNVMRSIKNPLTFDILTGNLTDVPEQKLDTTLDIKYYIRRTNRRDLLTYPMLQFHNHCVKSQLFQLFKNMKTNDNKRFHLLDVACGKGGDIDKWYDANFEKVIGFDINLDNIINPSDGAYVRYQKSYDSNLNRGKNVNMMFLQKDLSKPWNDYNEVTNGHMKKLYELVWGIQPKTDFASVLQKHYNVMKNKFDVISCQFAIHYMFETESKLRDFCSNINETLKTGGYLVGTCLDGSIVKNDLAKSPDNKIKGSIKDNTVWMIESKNFKNGGEVSIGDEISVYVESIGANHTEYLVSIELLKKYLREHNIRLLSDSDTRMLFERKSLSSFGNFSSFHGNANKGLQLSESALKKFSFMNMWFVFKKYSNYE